MDYTYSLKTELNPNVIQDSAVHLLKIIEERYRFFCSYAVQAVLIPTFDIDINIDILFSSLFILTHLTLVMFELCLTCD